MDFPDQQTYTLLRNIIPVEMKLEVATVPTVVTTSALMQWLRLRTNILKRHETQEALRKGRSKSTNASPLISPSQPESTAVITAPFNAPAAAKKPRSPSPGRGNERPRSASPGGRRNLPDPKYGKDGKPSCWFCDGTDHKRQDCEKYKAARKANGGKHVPGKFEDWKAKHPAKPRIAQLQEQELDTSDDEGDCPPATCAKPSTCGSNGTAPRINIWALPCKEGKHSHSTVEAAPEASNTDSLNDIFADLIDEEENELLAQLSTWAKVKPSRLSARRNAKKNAKAHQDWLLAVEEKKQLVTQELEDLDDDEELVLVDSGCGNHACNPKKHFKRFKMRPSPGSKNGQVFVTANEQQTANIGEKLVKFRTREGEQCQIVVQCADVAMPIFSTRKLGKTHRTILADEHQDHGFFEHRKTGARTQFFSKDGVYFLRIRLTPDMPDAEPRDNGFGRPA